MEKICIVKRRREYTQPEVKVTVTQPEISETITPEIVVSSIAVKNNSEFPDKKISEAIIAVTQPEISETITFLSILQPCFLAYSARILATSMSASFLYLNESHNVPSKSNITPISECFPAIAIGLNSTVIEKAI